MAFQRKTIGLNSSSGPIDRSGDGEEFPIAATGGIFFDRVDGAPIYVRFDENPVLVPIYAGRSIDLAFERFHIVHEAVHSGSIEAILYAKGEGIFDSPALSKDPFDRAHWDEQYRWPPDVRYTIGDPVSANFQLSIFGEGLNGSATTRQMWGSPYTGGTGADRMDFINERVCIRFAGGTGFRGRDAWALNPIQLPLTTRPAVKVGSFRRVWWDRYTIAKDAGADSNSTGIGYRPTGGLLGAFPSDAGGFGFGIFGTAGGGWAWQVYENAIAVETTALVWPFAVTSFVPVDFVWYAATPDANAKLRLYVNELLVLERNWEVGTLMPLYSDVANSMSFLPLVRGGAGRLLYVTDTYRRVGEYDKLHQQQ